MTTELPLVDELETVVEASAAAVYLATARRMSHAFELPGGHACSSLLKVLHRGENFTVPPLEGQEANGFVVARAHAPRELVLEGRHRFATYRLSFLIEPLNATRSRLRARTEAAFPGVRGSLYRALVIGSTAHRIIVKRVLRGIARRATLTNQRSE